MERSLAAAGQPKGYVARAQTMFELSRDWYAGRLDEGWTPYTASEAEEVFRRHGLTGEFWALG